MKEKKFTLYKDTDVRISFSVYENCTFHGKSILNFSITKSLSAHSNYEKHKDRIIKNVNEWSKNNWNKVKSYKRKWVVNNPDKVHLKNKKTKAKRKKELGYIILNEPCKDCDGHHIDKDHVLFIPKELHRSVPHNVHTGKNMELINHLAWNYIYREG